VKRKININEWISVTIIAAALIIGICIYFSGRLISSNIAPGRPEISGTILARLNGLEKKIKEIDSKLTQLSAVLQPKEPPKPGSKKVEGVDAGSNPVKGDMTAPVLLVEFSDFECPFSKRFYQDTFPKIDKEYIATGKVRFAYRDFPLAFHPQAENAAIAARCAGRQDKYWEMFNKLTSSSKLDADGPEKFAKELGLRPKAFMDCVHSAEIKDAVKKDMAEAAKFGVSGTPAFFINGRMIEGAYPYEAFKQIINEELAKTGAKK
jgi:protein-disulfide isomerase